MSSGDGPILFGAVGAAGQLNPMLVVAGELVRAGTRGLHFASTDERREEIERLGGGIRFVSMGEDVNPWYKEWDDETCHLVTGGHPRTIKPVVEFFRRDADPEAYEVMYRRAEEVVDRVRPSLMVLDLTMRYLVDVAIRREIPFVLSCPATPSAELDGVLPKGYPAPLTGFGRHLTGWRRAANSAFRLRLVAALVRKTRCSRSNANAPSWRRKAAWRSCRRRGRPRSRCSPTPFSGWSTSFRFPSTCGWWAPWCPRCPGAGRRW